MSHHHIEEHFTATEIVRDIVIGMSDGLTVPFALAAGLSGAIDSSTIIVTAGLAEIAAGSIAMGLGGFLAARTDAEHYASELKREYLEVVEKPELEKNEVREVFDEYGISRGSSEVVVEELSQNHDKWVAFMMRFELGLEEPNPRRAYSSAGTIAASYIAGGFIPLTPYIFDRNANEALKISVFVTLAALFAFGYFKGKFTGTRPLKSAFQTFIIGGLAAAAAYLLAKAIS